MNRKINIRKSTLIEKIKSNKQQHIKEYQKAVVAYKEEATKQLNKQLEEVEKGSINAHLNLVSPEDNSEYYDKIITMFEWEVNEMVELDKFEFDKYVLDEDPLILKSKMLNTTYLR